MNFWQNIKPAAHKKWLHLTAGLMWAAVGLYLVSLTSAWIQPASKSAAAILIISGVVLATIIYRFGFSKLANNNIRRIDAIKSEKPCIFAFQAWTSYPLVVFMISLGVFLRVYSPLPKTYLAVLYIGIGFNMFLASWHYFYRVFAEIK